MTNNEKKLNLADFFYVIRKCWIVECIILAVCIAAGVVIASFTPRYYVASTDVFVDAETGNDVTTGISVARVYIPSICDSAQGDYVLSVASRKTQKKCSSKNITVKNEDNSLIINISYKDSSPEDAKIKLVAIVDALKGFYEAETEEANPLANKKIKITPQYSVVSDDGTAQPKMTVGSKKKTIVLLSGILGVAAVFIYALCVYFIADKISSSDRLEAISGVKTLGVATNEKIDKKESKNPNRFVRHDLTRVSDSLVYDHICTGRQVYQVQSSIAGEGKTSVSINLAIGLAEAHRKTVIIDCDFANPSVHRRVSLHRHTGITDYFQGTKTFDEIVKLVDGYIDTGVKMGEGWLLTAEMLELKERGVKNVICAQPFGCLPNHICGKGMMKPLKDRNPDMNIVAVDYDAGASKVNQDNRIKLMLALAQNAENASDAV